MLLYALRIPLACVLASCVALVAACGAAQDTPTDAFYRVKDAVEDGEVPGVIEGFTEDGRASLALHCLFEAVGEQVRRPATDTFEELARRTDGEPLDPWPHGMRGGVEVLHRHGLDESWLTSLLDRVRGTADGASAEAVIDDLDAAVDDLPDRDAFLADIVPLARLAIFRHGSPRNEQVSGRRATVDVRYLKGEEDFAFGQVELVRAGSTWRIDAFR